MAPVHDTCGFPPGHMPSSGVYIVGTVVVLGLTYALLFGSTSPTALTQTAVVQPYKSLSVRAAAPTRSQVTLRTASNLQVQVQRPAFSTTGASNPSDASLSLWHQSSLLENCALFAAGLTALTALLSWWIRRNNGAEQQPIAVLSLGGVDPKGSELPSDDHTMEFVASRRLVLQTAAATQVLGMPLVRAPQARAASTPGFTIPEIGIGCWAWGDSLFWGYDAKNDAQLQDAFNFLLENNVRFFDTAEIYGFGRSEELLGRFAAEKGEDIAVATKFAALPWRVKPSDVVGACRRSLDRLGKDSLELYQIHFPNRWANEEYWDGLAQCYELGLVKAVGVSNYGKDAVRAVHAKLAERGIPLASNQIQYSLLYPYADTNGLKATCDELGVKVLAYSPLGLGLLTGKYSATNLPPGPRGGLARLYVEDGTYLKLIDTMRDVAAAHGIDRNDPSGPVQVALNWCRAKGTVPIPGVRTVSQAVQNIACLKWDMTQAEVLLLDRAAEGLPLPAVAPFPREDIFTHLQMFDS